MLNSFESRPLGDSGRRPADSDRGHDNGHDNGHDGDVIGADEGPNTESEVPPDPEFTSHEEWIHAISHGLGFVAALVGLVVLLVATFDHGPTRHFIAAAIFGITLTILYGSSTLYHGLPESDYKKFFRKLDHIAIYLLIAGTYTPFVVIKMPDDSGWMVLAVVWGLAALGITLELVRNSSTRRTSLGLYLLMGWLAVFALQPLFATLEPMGLALLILGGLTYTIGVIFYAWHKLPYNHAVWHGFVLGGSTLHFASVLGFVIP
jgi:hemolysin III